MSIIVSYFKIEKLNSTQLFQHIVGLIFYCNCDTGVIKYNQQTGERIQIRVCQCETKFIVIQTDILQKYKRIPYYVDTLFLDKNTYPVDNQYRLANWVLNNQLLLDWFTCDGEIV